VITYDEMSVAELKAAIVDLEASATQIDALRRAAIASRQLDRALDHDHERSRVVTQLTLAQGYLFRAGARTWGNHCPHQDDQQSRLYISTP